jgi:TupA-like ATPgrasp
LLGEPGYPAGMTTALDAIRAERDRLREELRELSEAGREPSFYSLYWSMKRQRGWLRHDHGIRDPVLGTAPKMASRSLAASLNVQVPRLLAGPTPIERLEEPDAECFVVKPVQGWSSRGVYALQRDGDGLLSVFDNRAFSWDEVRSKLAVDEKELAADAEAKGFRLTREVLVEELVPSGQPDRALPFDWKCYCIGGRVEVVMQKDAGDRRERSAARYKFWSPELTELGPVLDHHDYDASLPTPRDPQGLIETAERVARALPGLFVRIDLYDVPGGVVFGEITPQPGGPQRFTPDLDRRLGEAWERALAAEWARTIRDGRAAA